MTTTPIDFLSRMLERERLELSIAEMRKNVGKDNPLLDEGILYSDGLLSACGCDCEGCDGQDIIPFGDAFAHHCWGSGQFVPLTFEEAVNLSFDGNKFCKHLTELFECDPGKQIVPNKLWDLGRSNLPIGRHPKRRTYFAREVVRNPDEIFSKIPPRDKSYILVVGSNCLKKVDATIANRVFCISDIISVSKEGKWELDKERMNLEFGSPNDANDKDEKEKDSHAQKREEIKKVLQREVNRLCVFHQCEKLADRDKLMSEITLNFLANQTQIEYHTVRRVIEDWKPLEERIDKEIGSLWDTCNSVELIEGECKRPSVWRRKIIRRRVKR